MVCSETFAAIAGDRLANLCQGLARGLLHLAHLLCGASRVDGENAIGEFTLDGDDSERVAQQIMQVARNALTLCHLSQVLNLVIGAGELKVSAPLAGVCEVA